ncbi:MAG TPA: hypothetical protein VK644_10000 [Chitinophagaceae bacterium]|nr:hypothetical protein [Chitinophagaceae bacterium]
MKKILALGVVFALFSIAVSAQPGQDALRKNVSGDHFRSGQVTRGEQFKMNRNDAKFHKTKRRFHRDGHFNRFEKRKLHNMKKHNHRQAFRSRHNGHRRVM